MSASFSFPPHTPQARLYSFDFGVLQIPQLHVHPVDPARRLVARAIVELVGRAIFPTTRAAYEAAFKARKVPALRATNVPVHGFEDIRTVGYGVHVLAYSRQTLWREDALRERRKRCSNTPFSLGLPSRHTGTTGTSAGRPV